MNTLLGCGEQVKEALTWSVRQQCEQNWGALCESLRLCTPDADPPAPPHAAARPPPQSAPADAESDGPIESSQSPGALSPQEAGLSEPAAPESAGSRR